MRLCNCHSPWEDIKDRNWRWGGSKWGSDVINSSVFMSETLWRSPPAEFSYQGISSILQIYSAFEVPLFFFGGKANLENIYFLIYMCTCRRVCVWDIIFKQLNLRTSIFVCSTDVGIRTAREMYLLDHPLSSTKQCQRDFVRVNCFLKIPHKFNSYCNALW